MYTIKSFLVLTSVLSVFSLAGFQKEKIITPVQIHAFISKTTPAVGQKAPDIELSDVNGKKVRLSSLKGKVVLLDFWASWCGPCRKENPFTLEIYNVYKDKGFTVYSVSIDQDKQKWIKAVEKDELIWPYHVNDSKGWYGKAASTYGVEAIPATFLIDRDGTIVATDLRGAALDKFLKKCLSLNTN